MKRGLVVFALLISARSCYARSTLVVSAAASMKDVLMAIAAKYPAAEVKFNFASSGTLERQIENGAPVDIFISAADSNMNRLQKQNLIDPTTRRVLARNRLVLIVPKNSSLKIHAFSDLKKASIGKVALGAPASVPAGKYAQQVLERIGIWKQVEAKAVRGKDVREVLAQVEQGNVDAGIVYTTDAAISSKVKVVAVAPESTHAPIHYPFAVVADSKNQNAAKKFAAFLGSATVKRVLKDYRFVVN